MTPADGPEKAWFEEDDAVPPLDLGSKPPAADSPDQWQGLTAPEPPLRAPGRIEAADEDDAPIELRPSEARPVEVNPIGAAPLTEAAPETESPRKKLGERSSRKTQASEPKQAETEPEDEDPVSGWNWGAEAAALLAAGRFLTRLPFGSSSPAASESVAPSESESASVDATANTSLETRWRRDLQRGVAYFPFVGLLIGVATAVTLEFAAGFWPVAIAALLALAVDALLTGALHEDAVADCCDGFGGGWTTDDVLRIMKDSRVGSFGVLGLVFAFTSRFVLFSSLDPSFRSAAVIAAACLGRSAMTGLMLLVPPPANSHGLSRLAAARADFRTLALAGGATLLGILPLLIVAPARALGAILLAFFAAATFGLYSRARIGGATGDVLGAACVLAQIGALLAAAALAPTALKP